jgi:hypothetical protein
MKNGADYTFCGGGFLLMPSNSSGSSARPSFRSVLQRLYITGLKR